MGAERWDEQVGSVADEATRLLESLRRSAQDAAAAGPENGRPAEEGAPPHTSDRTHVPEPDGDTAPRATNAHDPFCTWCPLCRSAAVLRSLSPETLVRLADLAGVAASVLADLAGARARAAGDHPPADGTPSTRGTAAPPSATAHPIPILDADDPREAPRG